jgi:L-ribulose-5-phosphate 4-epimerase
MSEGYSGVKFTTVYKNKTAPEHSGIEVLRNWCHIFHEKGLAPPYPGGSYGNLSYRTDRNTFIITGTCIGLKDDLTDDCFVEIHDCNVGTGQILVTGSRPPSSETLMHDSIYRNRPDVNAIFHGHNEQITMNAERLKIPDTAQEVPYGTPELAGEVLKILESNQFIVIRKHGFVSMGFTMALAGELANYWLSQASQY